MTRAKVVDALLGLLKIGGGVACLVVVVGWCIPGWEPGDWTSTLIVWGAAAGWAKASREVDRLRAEVKTRNGRLIMARADIATLRARLALRGDS